MTNSQHGFNCLYVASAYFPYDYYVKVMEALTGGAQFAAEIESGGCQQRLQKLLAGFVRGFNQWLVHFPAELEKFLQDARECSTNPRTPSEEGNPRGIVWEGQAG